MIRYIFNVLLLGIMIACAFNSTSALTIDLSPALMILAHLAAIIISLYLVFLLINESNYKEELDKKEAIINAVYEGAEQWEEEYYDCRDILERLVELKNLKDKEGKTDFYKQIQPLLWDEAKQFLKNHQHH